MKDSVYVKMTADEAIEWLFKWNLGIVGETPDCHIGHRFEEIKVELNRLREENEELFDYVESVADWTYRGDGGSDEYGEGEVQNKAKELVAKFKGRREEMNQDSAYTTEPMADNVLKALVWELPESVARHALPIIQAELDRLRKENRDLMEKIESTKKRFYEEGYADAKREYKEK